MELKSATLITKKCFELPAGATLVSKEVRTEVEEIENGFLIRNSYDIKWKAKGSDSNNYEYYNKTWFSETNPIEITMPKEVSLADKL